VIARAPPLRRRNALGEMRQQKAPRNEKRDARPEHVAQALRATREHLDRQLIRDPAECHANPGVYGLAARRTVGLSAPHPPRGSGPSRGLAVALIRPTGVIVAGGVASDALTIGARRAGVGRAGAVGSAPDQ